MGFVERGPNIRDRVLAVLRGERPDRIPFMDRITLWYTSHNRAGDTPRSSPPPILTRGANTMEKRGLGGPALPGSTRCI